LFLLKPLIYCFSLVWLLAPMISALSNGTLIFLLNYACTLPYTLFRLWLCNVSFDLWDFVFKG
jgi:hypothetical protein